jgi:HEAT repeat protein
VLTALDWFAELTSGDDRRAERASAALARLGRRPLPRLLELMRSDSADHRWWAVRCLAAIPEVRADRALVEALGDPYLAVRQAAALALRQRPMADAIPALLALLGSDDALLARLAGDALAACGAAATAALAQAAKDPSPAVRIGAVRALAMNDDPGAIPALYAALEDPSAMVEYWACEGLERRGLGMVYFLP